MTLILRCAKLLVPEPSSPRTLGFTTFFDLSLPPVLPILSEDMAAKGVKAFCVLSFGYDISKIIRGRLLLKIEPGGVFCTLAGLSSCNGIGSFTDSIESPYDLKSGTVRHGLFSSPEDSVSTTLIFSFRSFSWQPALSYLR